MTRQQLIQILNAKKIFKTKEIQDIKDLGLDFKQVRNYNMFMKLDVLERDLRKLVASIEYETKKIEQEAA